MYVKNVHYTNFRNYENLDTELSDGINVVMGQNAQGKTNLIEGIYLCALGKSFRNVPEKDLILFGKKNSEIMLDFNAFDTDNQISVELGDKKIIKYNGLAVAKRSELIGKLSVVLFTPQEINIVSDSPIYRRRFMDICAGSLRYKYLYALSCYNKVLEQKNKLLKTISQNPSFAGTLDVWNDRLCEYGALIVWYRKSLISKIKEKIKPVFLKISNGSEQLSLAYITNTCEDGMETVDDIRKSMKKRMTEKQQAEIISGISLVGIHRDDIYFYINGKKVKSFASQGQKRSVVLALKLVQTELVFDETGEYPVLLLDDITSELDVSRRSFLYNEIKDKQVIITCTDAEAEILGGASEIFEIKENKIFRK